LNNQNQVSFMVSMETRITQGSVKAIAHPLANSTEHSHFREPDRLHLVKKLFVFHEIRTFTALFTAARQYNPY